MSAAPTKQELLLALLERASAFVQLDGRAAGVVLPEWLRADVSVVLQLGYDLAVPIHDLEIDEASIRCTLSFRRTPFACVIPWTAIYGMADPEGRGAIFPESVPSDSGPTHVEAPPAPPPPPEKKPRPNHLKLVK